MNFWSPPPCSACPPLLWIPSSTVMMALRSSLSYHGAKSTLPSSPYSCLGLQHGFFWTILTRHGVSNPASPAFFVLAIASFPVRSLAAQHTRPLARRSRPPRCLHQNKTNCCPALLPARPDLPSGLVICPALGSSFLGLTSRNAILLPLVGATLIWPPFSVCERACTWRARGNLDLCHRLPVGATCAISNDAKCNVGLNHCSLQSSSVHPQRCKLPKRF